MRYAQKEWEKKPQVRLMRRGLRDTSNEIIRSTKGQRNPFKRNKVLPYLLSPQKDLIQKPPPFYLFPFLFALPQP